MKLLSCLSPGEFEYQEAEMPKVSKGKAIVKIKRIGICGTDLHAFEGTQPYFSYPRILGHELAGEVVDIEENNEISKGDQVTVIPYFSCGTCIACRNGKPNCCQKISVFGVHEDGGMREFVSVPLTSLVKKEGLNLDQLALAEPFAIGAHGVRRAGVKPGQTVLVIGAGPIGLGVMEFARIAGAKVIAMDINEQRLQFCKDAWNIPHVVKAGSSAHEQIQEITNNDFCDVVIDATGSLAAINAGFQFIAHGGAYVLVGLQKGEIAFSHPEFHKREATLMSSRNATREDFDQVLEAMTSGQLSIEKYITHKVKFDQVKNDFQSWLKPETGVIKAVVEL
ncbi:2-desacetyl-2-hydroxyethyl bacteriochlorophyllide A dehydrogenase [Algoriphagus iocasae]|jgi:2-desacetyl-2-hydroxyethyl bacteriochlorophyllide A dehydrogenase|uniref:2-desacetyl-2-hydroxyethyl bacteriochlorophyllide A dehydrogenase n=1 Tax=Algoriphagus iocasae TaxID=1836499 RepID=A0A841MUS4_9BACT|nr:zinc-binding alcohol dehydrogenase family protein [Algoriphagus iocasae]MBB6325761.1 2-desacetyl-2-hydroxyethyl bacteriochlorophyllide A dehydrogenase [Algoriphagus iocasae]